MTAKITKKIEKKIPKPKQVVAGVDRSNLRSWNLRFALLLVAQAVAIVLIGGGQTAPVTWQYLTTNALASEASGHQVLAVATRHLFDLQLSWLVAKFLLIFATVYLVAATVWRSKYEAWLERGVNKLRWVGFGVGGGAVAVVVAMLSGVSDLAYLWLIFGMVALAGLLAMAIELVGPERRLRRLLAVGAVGGITLSWLVLAGAGAASLIFNGSLPGFMYYTYGSMTLLVVAAALAGYLRLKERGSWADTLYTERMFMLLGFVAVSVLAWQIFAGALQP